MIDVLQWAATLACIVANILVVKKLNGYLLWFVGTGILFCFAIVDHNWARAVLFFIYELINVWGFIKWRKDKNQGREIID